MLYYCHGQRVAGHSKRTIKMATRSLIGMQVENGIKTMYCHLDGYISEVGVRLATHYTDPVKVAKLIELGYISGLGLAIERCVRPDPSIAPTLHAGAKLDNLWDEAGQEWEYLYTREGKWLVRHSSYGREVGPWNLLVLDVDGKACVGGIYHECAQDPTKVKAPRKRTKASTAVTLEPAIPATDSDSFADVLACLDFLPDYKKTKVLPALKALLEMVEG